jgi:Dephospho-CoA kinase
MSVIVTGGAGAGKTTIARALAADGIETVDGDTQRIARWTYVGGAVVPDTEIDFRSPVWNTAHRWRWDAVRVAEVFRAGQVWCGYAANLDDFLDRFDTVIGLRMDAPTMLARMADPRRDNPWGVGEAMSPYLVRQLADIEAHLDRIATVHVDATRPLPEVLAAVLGACAGRVGF